MLNRRSFLALSATTALAISLTGESIAAQTASWKHIPGSIPPPPRWDHTLSADSNRERLIVACGRDDSGIALGDCYVADRANGDWRQIEANGPEARFGHAVAVDRESDTLYLFGGQNADVFYNDLWALELE
ncbi:MAG: Kelch repeat-containing protein, partial [Thermomicrobiales bacterium]